MEEGGVLCDGEDWGCVLGRCVTPLEERKGMFSMGASYGGVVVAYVFACGFWVICATGCLAGGARASDLFACDVRAEPVRPVARDGGRAG